MQAAQILSDEWLFQLVVVAFYTSGFMLSLCAMEVVTCVYAEITGQSTDLPTQKEIRRLFLRFRRLLIWSGFH